MLHRVRLALLHRTPPSRWPGWSHLNRFLVVSHNPLPVSLSRFRLRKVASSFWPICCRFSTVSGIRDWHSTKIGGFSREQANQQKEPNAARPSFLLAYSAFLQPANVAEGQKAGGESVSRPRESLLAKRAIPAIPVIFVTTSFLWTQGDNVALGAPTPMMTCSARSARASALLAGRSQSKLRRAGAARENTIGHDPGRFRVSNSSHHSRFHLLESA